MRGVSDQRDAPRRPFGAARPWICARVSCSSTPTTSWRGAVPIDVREDGRGHALQSAGCRAPSVDRGISGTRDARGSDQARLRHTTAAAYRCFLPDLTGFTGRRCTGPDRQRHATHAATATPDLGRGFSPAGADCGYRAPLAPRLARLFDGSGQSRSMIWRRGRDSNPRAFRLPAFQAGALDQLCDLSRRSRESYARWVPAAERAGFEPARLSPTAFRELHHQPLGHLSRRKFTGKAVV